MKINYLILLLICWRPKLPNFFPFFWSRQSPVYLKEEKNIHSIFFHFFLLLIVIKFPVDLMRCLKLTDLIYFLPTISPLRSSFLEEFKLKTKSLLFPVKKRKFETLVEFGFNNIISTMYFRYTDAFLLFETPAISGIPEAETFGRNQKFQLSAFGFGRRK